MKKLYGYGVSIRNTPISVFETVAYQELKHIGYIGGEAVVDIVRSDSYKRPKLMELIDELDAGDRIDMYSVDALLTINPEKSIEYYSAILKKGIELIIFDFSGALIKLSPYSNTILGQTGDEYFIKSNKSDLELINDFSDLAYKTKPQTNAGGLKSEKRTKISEAFKKIYFAYESYQIDQATTLSLISEYCGIENKITFWLMAKDYETSLDYLDDIYSQPYEFFELPKRCGGIPKEYREIINCANAISNDGLSEKERIVAAMNKLNMISDYKIFRRWDLLAKKTPKPRKPVLIDFDIDEFRKTYKPYRDDQDHQFNQSLAQPL